ncbi:MAG: leucine-rich repeat domain-containing protein [Clostridia bacterium]|nr:leucine-rich repeat domain-containing protein [Clostridia bacterium]
MVIRKITDSNYDTTIGTIRRNDNAEAYLAAPDSQYFTSINGVLYSKDVSKLLAVPKAMKGTLFLPKETKFIYMSALYKSSLNTIIGEGVTRVFSSAFEQSTIQNCYLPSVDKIGKRAFYQCTELHHIDLCQVFVIEADAFSSSGLFGLTIPVTTRIINGSFDYCDSLAWVIVRDRTSNDPPLLLGNHAFEGCYNLKDFTFKEGKLNLKGSVFKENYSLKDVVFPAVDVIPDSTFVKCTSLMSITIGSECQIPKNLKRSKVKIEMYNKDQLRFEV